MNLFTKLKVSFQDLIDLCGGVKSFIVMSVAILIITPFILLYFFVLRPTYRGIRVLLDAKELGWKTAYRKHFYPDEYEHEEWKKADEERERMNVPLLPAGKYRDFKDKKVWPDAYVVDGVAIYANEGRTLLYVHDRIEEFDVPEGVVNIYHRCFMNCDVMKRVSLPSTIQRIGKKAFYSCVVLQELAIPDSVTTIDEDMLMNCSSLTKVAIPSHITAIPDRMFSQCRSLRELELSSKTQWMPVLQTNTISLARVGNRRWSRCLAN